MNLSTNCFSTKRGTNPTPAAGGIYKSVDAGTASGWGKQKDERGRRSPLRRKDQGATESRPTKVQYR